jgi:small-conductance mechanosensitive channel
MKFLRFYILYRLPIVALLIILGVLSHVYGDAILAWILYFLAFISLLLYFLIGTMRLVKEAVEDGNVDDALVYIKTIWPVQNKISAKASTRHHLLPAI